MTISPGPMIASRVFSCAGRPRRGAVSSSRIVPSAPRMSPACISSRTVRRPWFVVVVMVRTSLTPVRGTGRQGEARGTRHSRARAHPVTDPGCGVQDEGANACRNGGTGTSGYGAVCGPDYWNQNPSVSPPSGRGTRGRPPAAQTACAALDTCSQENARRTAPGQTPLTRQSFGTSRRSATPRNSGTRLRSHLAFPLKPGKGVLIRRVSRPVGSVACVREDASPNEVSHEQ